MSCKGMPILYHVCACITILRLCLISIPVSIDLLAYCILMCVVISSVVLNPVSVLAYKGTPYVVNDSVFSFS